MDSILELQETGPGTTQSSIYNEVASQGTSQAHQDSKFSKFNYSIVIIAKLKLLFNNICYKTTYLCIWGIIEDHQNSKVGPIKSVQCSVNFKTTLYPC